MSTVFISYRREIAAGEARALFNDLAERLGENSVFMDVDSIALGRDFRSVLQEVLASCNLMLVLIGRNWVDVKDEEGRTRLGDPGDFVRLEIEAGLKRDIAITPVLVQGAQMPAADKLPPEIKDLAYRNGFELSHSRWESDVGEMIRRLGLDVPVAGRQIDSIMRAGNRPLPTVATVPPDRCRPADSAGYPITRDQMYFTIRINEMHLAENRQWWTDYNPLVVVVTEFNHAQERVVVPTVIGPNLIRKQAPADQPRYGVVVLDARVTGPHPYRGGDVDISVGFYRVQRADHARVLLNIVDSLSAALGAPGELQTIAKTGGALLQGVEGLLGLRETSYLAGHRVSMATSPFDPFTAGYSALIAPPAPADLVALRVEDRRLYIDADGGSRPYRDSDFLLLSFTGSEARGDENLLPFYPLKLDALTAVWDGEDGVKRGKAILITAYQQMRRSPDVTAAEATRLFDAWLREFDAEKKRAEQVRSMPVERHEAVADPLAQDLNDALRRLAL
jgi:TIR domain